MRKRKNRLSVDEYVHGIRDGDIMILSRAITLVESSLSVDNIIGQEVIEQLLPHTGKSMRVGITGVPGVGKSTFIESLGQSITAKGSKIAVLAIDPSSQRTGGSIMGDKTRMESLAHDPLAYIRPSASGETLGGVAHKTREAMLLCEAAGYDVIFIETVGVGQSEIAVKSMVDFFLLLMLAGAGDELQGIKKGIMEMADGIAITKADGDNIKAAKKAKAEYANALHLFPPTESGWIPQILTCSSMDKSGLSDVWEMMLKHRDHLSREGYLDKYRVEQNTTWMHQIISERLKREFYNNSKIKEQLEHSIYDVQSLNKSPARVAEELFSLINKS